MLSPPSSSQLLYSTRPPFMLNETLPLMPTVPSSWPVWLLTPGTSVTRLVKLRPLSSSWVISFPVTTPASSEDWVSTCATLLPSTTTSVVAAPTSRVTSTRAFSPTSSFAALTWYFLKPLAVTITSYVPGDSADSLYSPVELVVVWRVMPRSGLVTTTLAPLIAAPEGSFTVPVIDPV